MEKKYGIGWGVGLFGLGALCGAVLGLLFAPKEGAEARKLVGDLLKEKARETKDTLELKRAQITAAAQAGRKAYEEVHS